MHKVLDLWWAIAPYLKTPVPIIISLIALYFSLHDRRPRLRVRMRRGDWAKIGQTQTGDVMFKGVIEIYNASSRANTVSDYVFHCKRKNEWVKMESERYEDSHPGGKDHSVANPTPLAIGPYSGVDVNVIALTDPPLDHEMVVRIEVEDLFGKKYRSEVLANDVKPF
jgi:hypothetical protein